LPISVRTGHGLDNLLDALLDKLKTLIISREAPSLSRKRHRLNLEDALCALKRSQGADLPELMAEDLRLSIRALGKITGRVDVEDLLDVIFRDFCIGK
jgi:tRNA modification GTPase